MRNQSATSVVDRDPTTPVNVLMLIAGAMLGSAVFAAVAAGEGIPVVVGILLPWLALTVAAVFWLADDAARERRRVREEAAIIKNARREAVGMLLADEPQPKARLESAAALLLDPNPTAVDANHFLTRSQRLLADN